jgi:phosphoglucosamine mutase
MGKRSRLFGTDGIRDVAGEGKLRVESVVRVGAALAGLAREDGRRSPRVLLGRDTRASGPLLQAALTAGLLAGGARPADGGVLPTPAVALLARRRRYDLGVVLSASHNPHRDNGIKVFGRDGRKLPDEREDRVQELARAEIAALAGDPAEPTVAADAEEDYVEEVLALADPPSLQGLRVVVDCANGAAFRTAPEALRRLGAEVVPVHASPDGKNINRRCGALHPSVVARAVRREKAHLGLALDGDADRALFADEKGHVRDGDAVLLLLARDLHRRRRLRHRTVVGTVMANVGLETVLTESGFRLLRTPVGDRHVGKAMVEGGFALGGEPSGHVLVRAGRRPLVGDGLVTALHVLRVLQDTGRRFSDLVGDLKPAPQALVNVRVVRKPRLLSLAPVRREVAEVERVLGSRGRVLLRYSGTEPKARVMVEGPDAGAHAERIAEAVRAAIGNTKSHRKDS